MNASSFNLIELVDFALTNARQAGHEPDQAAITILWRIARREASPEEIEASSRSARQQLEAKAATCYPGMTTTDHDLIAIADRLQVLLDNLPRQIAVLSSG